MLSPSIHRSRVQCPKPQLKMKMKLFSSPGLYHMTADLNSAADSFRDFSSILMLETLEWPPPTLILHDICIIVCCPFTGLEIFIFNECVE